MGGVFRGSPQVVQAPAPPPTPAQAAQQVTQEAQQTAMATAAARRDTEITARERADERRRRTGSGARVLAGAVTSEPMVGSKTLLG
jgi:hypothetical protein